MKVITVSEKVAEAIDNGLIHYKADELLQTVATLESVERGSYLETLSEIPFDTLVRATYFGYETPSSKLSDYIVNMVPENTADYDAYNVAYLKGKADGARDAAKILGVELPKENTR